MPHELPSDLRLRIAGNKKVSRKSQNYTGHNLMPSLLHSTKFLVLALKRYSKTDIKVFWFCLTLFDFLIVSQNILQMIAVFEKF